MPFLPRCTPSGAASVELLSSAPSAAQVIPLALASVVLEQTGLLSVSLRTRLCIQCLLGHVPVSSASCLSRLLTSVGRVRHLSSLGGTTSAYTRAIDTQAACSSPGGGFNTYFYLLRGRAEYAATFRRWSSRLLQPGLCRVPGSSHPGSLVPGAPGALLRWAAVVRSYFLILLHVLPTARSWVHGVEPSRVAFYALPAVRLLVHVAVPSYVALRMVAGSPSPSPSGL